MYDVACLITVNAQRRIDIDIDMDIDIYYNII